MDEKNKARWVYDLKMIAIFMWMVLTVITCVGVWNYNPEGFVKWCALALAVCNGVIAVKYYLRLKADNQPKKEE